MERGIVRPKNIRLTCGYVGNMEKNKKISFPLDIYFHFDILSIEPTEVGSRRQYNIRRPLLERQDDRNDYDVRTYPPPPATRHGLVRLYARTRLRRAWERGPAVIEKSKTYRLSSTAGFSRRGSRSCIHKSRRSSPREKIFGTFILSRRKAGKEQGGRAADKSCGRRAGEGSADKV